MDPAMKEQTACRVKQWLGKKAMGFRRHGSAMRRAQAAVEFAFLTILVIFLLIVGVQFAMIGNAALALGQMNYQGARYAAVNPNADQTAVTSYMVSVGSPTVTTNNGANLTVTLTPNTARTFGQPVTVSVVFNAASLVVLPNPFFGISFPTQLQSTETAMTEG